MRTRRQPAVRALGRWRGADGHRLARGAASGGSVVEKNWVPWALNGSLYMSYSLDPHIVLRVPCRAPRPHAPARARRAGHRRRTSHAMARVAGRGKSAEDAAAEDGGAAARGGVAACAAAAPAVRIDATRLAAHEATQRRRGGRSVLIASPRTPSTRRRRLRHRFASPFALGRHAAAVAPNRRPRDGAPPGGSSTTRRTRRGSARAPRRCPTPTQHSGARRRRRPRACRRRAAPVSRGSAPRARRGARGADRRRTTRTGRRRGECDELRAGLAR